MKVYKIRRIADGLYSTGGTSPKWNKHGKTWNTVGHIKNHLAMFKEYNYDIRGYVSVLADYYTGCEIVVYETTIAEVETLNVV